MRRLLPIAAAVVAATSPALAIDASRTSISCAGAVTTGQGTSQSVRDLEPSDLPILAYGKAPAEREFKQLAQIGDVPVRVYAYRVNDTIVRLRIYEETAGVQDLLADTDFAGDMTQLSYRSLGGDTLVTAYCY